MLIAHWRTFGRRSAVAIAVLSLGIAACDRRGGCRGEYCGAVVIAAIGQTVSLLPPVTDESLDRDIHDQIFLKLADIGMDGSTINEAGFEPQLARSWEWSDPLTLTFHLDPRARWQDGPPVTAADVAFTFDAYADTLVNSPFGANLRRIASVTATDSLTVTIRFRDRYPEMLYDAVHHVRVLPAHLLQSVPRDQWRTTAFGRAPVGNGPYRFVRWTPGESIELAADSTFFLSRPYIRRLVWRIVADIPTAVTQLVAGEVDALQILITPTNIERARAVERLTLYPYPGTAYGALVFNLRANGDPKRPHPILADPDVRRALIFATDRDRMLQSVFAGAATVPPAPIPKLWASLWFSDLPVPPYDTAQASRLLERRGWRDTDGDGIRDRNGQKLALHIAVPTTSAVRMQYATLLQEQLRIVGVEVVTDAMDGAALSERTRGGQYDAALLSWVTDPSPSSGLPQLWRRGGSSNLGRYDSPAFDRQVDQAVTATTQQQATTAWRAALGTLAEDAPAMVLYALENVAAIDRRIADVRIRPDSWVALIRTWRIPPDQLTERDRLGN
ncbi:MAG TPA: ABC transporter substrate-binding protein [Gemmatimonadales bacterium]|jgi:peptide/nickel transport system substrate-binding protein